MTNQTTSYLWDCNCDFQYIHPNTTKQCSVCKCHEEDGPESRPEEADQLINHHPTAIKHTVTASIEIGFTAQISTPSKEQTELFLQYLFDEGIDPHEFPFELDLKHREITICE